MSTKPARKRIARSRTSIDGAATTPMPQRTGSFKPRPDQTATPVEDEPAVTAPPKGPVEDLSTKTHQTIERVIPGAPQDSQVQQVNPQRNIVRRIPR